MQLDRRALQEGAFLALEHSARLITDAALLYSNRSYSTAFVLAVIAREELGRSNRLWGRYAKLPESQTIPHRELATQLQDHIARLDAGQSTTHTPLSSEEIHTLRSSADPVGTGDLAAVLSKVRKRGVRIRKHDPGTLHQRRLKAMYVGINSDGTWSRPSQTGTKDAQHIGLTVKSEVGDALMAIEQDEAPRSAASAANVQLPSWSEFQNQLLFAFCEAGA